MSETVQEFSPALEREKMLQEMLDWMRGFFQRYERMEAALEFFQSRQPTGPGTNGSRRSPTLATPSPRVPAPSLDDEEGAGEEPTPPTRRKPQRRPPAPRTNTKQLSAALVTRLDTQPAGLTVKELIQYARAQQLLSPRLAPISAAGVVRDAMNLAVASGRVRRQSISIPDETGHLRAAWRFLPKSVTGETAMGKTVGKATKKTKGSQRKGIWPGAAEAAHAIMRIVGASDRPLLPFEIANRAVEQFGFAMVSPSGKDRLSNLIARVCRETLAGKGLRTHRVPNGGGVAYTTQEKPTTEKPGTEGTEET